MVSGAADAVERVRPLLDTLARSAPVVGDQPGDGQKVKLVNQLLCGVHIAAAAEALAFAEAMGLDAGAVRDVIRDGAAASFMLDDRGERMVDGAFDEAKSALDIFVKDMGLVTEAARSVDYATPLAAAAEALYVAGSKAGLGRQDDSSVIEVARGNRRLAGADDDHADLAARGRGEGQRRLLDELDLLAARRRGGAGLDRGRARPGRELALHAATGGGARPWGRSWASPRPPKRHRTTEPAPGSRRSRCAAGPRGC